MRDPTSNQVLVRFGASVAVLLSGLSAHSAETADLPGQPLDTITVLAAGVSDMTAASAGDISQAQIHSAPLLRPAAILENVPGLIVTQHSGEGKANQYFLRAFNLDHGTDLALEVDDMPVNMPTHAHGQGYSDFSFVIPASESPAVLSERTSFTTSRTAAMTTSGRSNWM
jgi:hypothetical protein